MTDPIREQLEPLIRDKGIRAVAAEAGVSHALVSFWLAGKRTLTPDVLDRIAAACGLEVRTRLIRRRKKRTNAE